MSALILGDEDYRRHAQHIEGKHKKIEYLIGVAYRRHGGLTVFRYHYLVDVAHEHLKDKLYEYRPGKGEKVRFFGFCHVLSTPFLCTRYIILS